jgi:hypothetical protein
MDMVDELYGFPDRTDYYGGYDTESNVEIKCGAYRAIGVIPVSTGEIWQFFSELQNAYRTLHGEAHFHSYEGNLDFVLAFGGQGHWTLEGTYQEHLHLPTQLRFQIEGDQSYLPTTLTQLAQFVAKYGDNFGIPR